MIALFTDFQTSDGIGQVRGVIKSLYEDAEILDFHHFVPSFKIRSGAFLLLNGYKFFPEGTIFYCVVDPGVGSQRKAIVIKTKNYYFVGPDNGLMFPAAKDDGIEEIIELAREGSSFTFEGRDVFAPAAARLEAGEGMSGLGSKITSLLEIDVDAKGSEGEIMFIEHYGNVVTNIVSLQKKEQYEVVSGDYKAQLKFHRSFSDAADGELFLIEGSRRTLELSVKQGSAADLMKCSVGDTITIR